MRKPPLHAAATNGDLGKVIQLLQKGTPVNAHWVEGYTALHLAADEGHADVAFALIKAGANIRVKAGHFNETPLHTAALRGATEIVEALLKAGANVNALDNRKRMPLHYAASGYEGTLTAAKMLLKAGARVDARDEDRDTPLAVAALHQNLGVVYLLVGAGASLTKKNIYGQTPKDIAEVQLSSYVVGGYVPADYKVNASVVRDIIRLTTPKRENRARR